VNTLYMWERAERNPSISNLQAWSEALGFRLVVELADVDSEFGPVMLRTREAVEAARLIDAMDEGERDSVLRVIRLINPMT
jgi:transcriptional regulator with XRE-family HTH domain